jgi:hypothetical protein
MVDGKRLKLKEVFRDNVKSVRAEMVRARYIRTGVADWVYKLNDQGSNWVLTCMFCGMVLLVGKVGLMEFDAHVINEGAFRRRLVAAVKRVNIDLERSPEAALDFFAARWAEWESRFRYLQALGPAVGFILTVSSLIQALHPAVQAANDLEEFLRGVHVAMVSTFLGLALRLLAIEGARVNDAILARAELEVMAAEKPKPTGEPVNENTQNAAASIAS